MTQLISLQRTMKEVSITGVHYNGGKLKTVKWILDCITDNKETQMIGLPVDSILKMILFQHFTNNQLSLSLLYATPLKLSNMLNPVILSQSFAFNGLIC
jgi:hypothetical protein